jgi:hypothetical protein
MPEAVYGGGVPCITANAPVAADGVAAAGGGAGAGEEEEAEEDGVFGWHVDADPLAAPPSPWTDAFGRYPNRARGRPRFVSARSSP